MFVVCCGEERRVESDEGSPRPGQARSTGTPCAVRISKLSQSSQSGKGLGVIRSGMNEPTLYLTVYHIIQGGRCKRAQPLRVDSGYPREYFEMGHLGSQMPFSGVTRVFFWHLEGRQPMVSQDTRALYAAYPPRRLSLADHDNVSGDAGRPGLSPSEQLEPSPTSS